MDVGLLAGIIMITSVVIMLAIGMPISISIGASSAMALGVILPPASAFTTSAQKIFTGIDSFALLAIPFFVLAGNIMNNGGIAIRLVNIAKLVSGRLPGSVAQTNIVGNMMFGAISGSGNAAAAAIGGTMAPIMEQEGYGKDYIAAVNIASAPTGQIIPPSNTLIVFSTVAGGVSVAALFMAGYLPGILWGMSVMIVAGFIAKKRNYQSNYHVTAKEAVKIILDGIPSLLLIIIIIGGILKGIFTATEGSAIAVVYALILSLCYRSLKVKDLYGILLESCKTTSIILMMIAMSSIMSWVMAYTRIPTFIAASLLSVTDNKYIILLLMNILLLLVGTFMDPTPALLIFTPIFLPVCQSFGMNVVHFGVMIVFNLCFGGITPPVGTILFTGCRVAKVKIEEVIKTMLPFFVAIVVVLMLVTYVPQITLLIPSLFGLV